MPSLVGSEMCIRDSLGTEPRTPGRVTIAWIPPLVGSSDPVPQLGSNALAPAVTATLDLVGRQPLFSLTGYCFLVLL